MSFQRKLIIVALASALPMASAFAQSTSDLKAEIEALKAQLMKLQKQVEAVVEKNESAPTSQQVTRLEQKQELADDALLESGLKGLKAKGVIEVAYVHDTQSGAHTVAARDGSGGAGNAMLEITKETEDGEGVNWTLRLTPGAGTLVQEATVSVGVGSDGARVYGGLIPDFQGYEMLFANANPLMTHNALYDLAGPATYTGLGMTHQLNKDVALKWMLGNIDSGNDVDPLSGASLKPTTGLAYRFDWTLSEYAYLGLSGAHASSTRSFDIVAIDGGFIRGDWVFNGHLNFSQMKSAAYNGGDASWMGVSGLVGYKLTPRLQLLARADYLENRKNGGGTYVSNYLGDPLGATNGLVTVGYGLGPELDDTGTVLDANVGANLTRLSVGTNYLLNASTQWKTEFRFDQSTGYNFVNESGAARKEAATIGTALVVSF
jgi:hypothetical protein